MWVTFHPVITFIICQLIKVLPAVRAQRPVLRALVFLVGFRLWVTFHSVYSNRRRLRNVSCVNVSKVKLSFHKQSYVKTLNNTLLLKLLLTYHQKKKKRSGNYFFFQRKTVLKISYKNHSLYHVQGCGHLKFKIHYETMPSITTQQSTLDSPQFKNQAVLLNRKTDETRQIALHAVCTIGAGFQPNQR